MLVSGSDSSFPENDTKKSMRRKVDYFSQLPSFLLKTSQTLPIPSFLPHPVPTTNLLPPQSPSLPTNTPFFPASPLVLLLSQLLAQGSCPGSPILAEILTSLSNPGQSWHRHAGSPWEKAGRSAWGCGLRAHRPELILLQSFSI